MATEKANNGKGGLNGRTATAVAIAGAIFGSLSGPFLLVKFGGDTALAPDRFTGTQGAAVIARVKHLESEVEHIETQIGTHLGNHPDQVRNFDARLAENTAKIELILANQVRILNKLDGMN